MFYRYDPKNGIKVPEPFCRTMTPIFMGDDDQIADAPFSIHMTEWEAGCEIDEHSHPGGMEAMYCVEGRGKATVAGIEHEFAPGAMIVAPPGTPHKIKNIGEGTLRVFCVFAPPVTAESLRKRAMEAVEQDRK